MEQENFSPQDSLRVIQSMLEKSKEDIRGNDIYFLMWGWITFIACTAQFLLKHVYAYPQHYRVWLLTFLGVILSVVISVRQRKQKKVRTYIDESMGFLWMGMGISFFVLSMILSRMGWNNNGFSFFILLYGLGTFISGKFLQFTPLVYGGIAAWVMAIVSVYFSYDYQILFAAAAILVSYIIPAFLLQNKNKSSLNLK